MKVAGFLKVRNEVIREGNLYRVLEQLAALCDCGVICDDASTDGTLDVVCDFIAEHPDWVLLPIDLEEQDWQSELLVKQRMMDALHRLTLHTLDAAPDWILWMDGDEVFDHVGLADFRTWLERVHDDPVDVYSFHYTQFWRSMRWARTDSGFDAGWFWKLWRYQRDLAFETSKTGLHGYQFPKNYVEDVLDFVDPRRTRRRAQARKPPPRAARAPFEILHLGNVGQNLVLKAVAYRDSGRLADASLKRHLYFGAEARYRAVPLPDPAHALQRALPYEPWKEKQPMPFTERETKLIEQMGRLRNTPGLVTVIVPTFNRGYTLKRTLLSLAMQTYEKWVCVVLDDGSTDATPEIMRDMEDADPRFFYCRYEENRGGVAMNEIGMALACEFGEFWVRLGSDDYFEPHKLQLDIWAFTVDPLVDVVYGPYRDLVVKESGEEELMPHLNNAPADVRGELLRGRFAASWANIAVRTRALARLREQHGAFCDPAIRNMEDYLVNVRLADQSEFGWRGLLASGELVYARNSVPNVPSAELLHDAIWRKAPDGASADVNAAIATADYQRTRHLIEARDPRRPMTLRLVPFEFRTR